ncbi:MAG TPA: hypothetical protein VKO35_00440, partial [Acidimicrobiia bacterium]|nr:hypothetical protein [Acidimicrobiia bacterium]
LWDQQRETEGLQRRLGIAQPLVEVFSNDIRLQDLAAWDPAAEVAAEAEALTGTNGAGPGPAAPPPPSASLRPRPGPARRRRRML